jgi:sensor domain CHASE-containing protein
VRRLVDRCIERVNGRALVAALVASVSTAFAVLGVEVIKAKHERESVCEAAIENRQVLRDLVELTRGSEFYRKAWPIVRQPVSCEEGGTS